MNEFDRQCDNCMEVKNWKKFARFDGAHGTTKMECLDCYRSRILTTEYDPRPYRAGERRRETRKTRQQRWEDFVRKLPC